MELLTDADWAAYRQLIKDASDTFGQQTIIWNSVTKRLAFSGDERNPDEITQISLPCLVQYNVFKLWPNSKETDTGELDKESVAVIFNRDYLNDMHYLNAHGNFEYNPDTDFFTLNGEKYYAAGDTHAGQAHDTPLHVYLILKRTPTRTGERVY